MNRRLRTLTVAVFGVGLVGAGAPHADAAPVAKAPHGPVAKHVKKVPAKKLSPLARAQQQAAALRAQAARLQGVADATDAQALGAARAEALAALQKATAERKAAEAAVAATAQPTDGATAVVTETPETVALDAARAAEKAAARVFGTANHRWIVAAKADRTAYLADRAADRAEAHVAMLAARA